MGNACCFTGHRDIREEAKEPVRRRIRGAVTALLAGGTDTFLVGGARGFDMLAAETLLDLREKEGKQFRLVSVLPFPAWREGWPEEEVLRQERILEKSDEISFSAGEHSRRAYLDRDREMVDRSSACIAYCTRGSGGTAYTVRYALKRGKTVLNTADWDLRRLEEQGNRRR